MFKLSLIHYLLFERYQLAHHTHVHAWFLFLTPPNEIKMFKPLKRQLISPHTTQLYKQDLRMRKGSTQSKIRFKDWRVLVCSVNPLCISWSLISWKWNEMYEMKCSSEKTFFSYSEELEVSELADAADETGYCMSLQIHSRHVMTSIKIRTIVKCYSISKRNQSKQ